MTALDPRFDALLAGFVGCADDTDRCAFILSHPVVVHDRFIDAFRCGDAQVAESYFVALRVVNAEVQRGPQDVRQSSVSFDAARWPMGGGPVEAIWFKVESFEISPALAVEQVRSPAFGDLLTLLYVQALCLNTDYLLRVGQIELALTRQRIIVQATEALADRPPLTNDADVWRLRYVAAHAWLQIGARMLTTVADPRLLRQALALGEGMLVQSQARADVLVQERMAQRLGLLYLDSYTAGRDLSDRHNYELSLAQWQQRLADHLGRAFDSLLLEDRAMPPVREALAAGERFLRQAMALRPGAPRGETIAALLQLLNVREILGERVDADEMIALAREALALLPANELERRIRVSGALRVLMAARKDLPAPANAVPVMVGDEIEHLLLSPPKPLLKQFGYRVLTDAVRQALTQLLYERQHAAGLQMIARFEWLLVDPTLADEEQRLSLWQIELRLVQGGLRAEPQGGDGASEVHRRLADLLDVARAAMPGNHEASALQALEEAIALGHEFSLAHDAALVSLRATLAVGEGTNQFNAGNLSAAAYWYALAVEDFAQLELPSQIWDALARLRDIVGAGSGAAMADVIARLEALLGAVPALGKRPAIRRLQEIFREASRYWPTGNSAANIDLETIFRTLRMAKGYCFAGALLDPAHYDWRTDDNARRQLRTIAALAAEVGIAAGSGDGDFAEGMLVDEAGLHEQRAGSDTEQRYENLRLAFDNDLRQRQAEGARAARSLTSRPGSSGDSGASLQAFQACIDPDCIVLDYFSGIGPDGRSVLHVLAITRDDCALCGVPLPAADIEARAAAGLDSRTDALGEFVRLVRSGVNALPGLARSVSRLGAAALVQGHALLLDSVRPFLASKRAKGARQLIVIPHGPLHFLPIHLMGPPDEPLAQDWRIAYLPAASMLVPRRASIAPPAAGLTAIGLDFRVPARPGVPAIDGAPAFVQELAGSVQGTALVNGDATKASVSAALASSRHVHVYTHGQQCAYAAAFHCLYLAPAADDDGVLCAYEALPLRCEGLEVLTLSACESALGRFDAGDNLTGLPGSLLLAGVQRIVGTLWPVAASTAETFFRCFYAALGLNPDPSAAFEEAQRAAQARHPQYRDWGAFYFIGNPSR